MSLRLPLSPSLRLPLFIAVLLSFFLCLSVKAATHAPAKTRELLTTAATLTAPLAERARALQQLALVASADAVPALAALLADEKLGHYARDVLEQMAHVDADTALLSALPRLTGDAQLGVINSLGLRRNVRAVDSLNALAFSDDAPTTEPPVPTVPASLFNGRDLAHWDGDPTVWRVRDGVIVGGSLDGNPRNEFLTTLRPYKNFVLRLDYRLVGTKGFVNGGVQFRSVRIDQPPNEMSGYQADIGAGHSGCLYDESRRKKFMARATAEQIKRLEKPGAWNAYEVRCEGPKITITLNGETTVTYTEEDKTIAPDGLIALQIHGNCSAEISFRNITLEALP